jgi:hypothetical protein
MTLSPNRPTTQELEDWCEMLMRWMARHECDDMRGRDPISYWQEFVREYPPVAAEMEAWLERQHLQV